jgi:ATP-dependent helicase/nuclease subunit A
VGEFLPKLPLPLGEGWDEGVGSRKSDSFPDFINAKIPIQPTPSIPLMPSLMREDVPASQSPLSGKAVLRGKLIHTLLQYLPEIESYKWQDKANEFLNKYDDEINLDEKKEILDAAFSVLNNKDIGHIFGSGSKAEVPIVGVVGNFVISGQIDRLLVSKNEVLIIDYKTNRNTPESQHDVHINYIKQMGAYKAALQEIYPDKKIKCALVWTSSPKIMWLDDSVLASLSLKNEYIKV